MYNSNFIHQPKLIDENDQFALKVKEAVKVVETILDNTRNPTLASPNHEHSYDDKYTLSEFITNTAVTSFLNVLDQMGLGSDVNSVGSGVLEKSTSSAAAAETLRKLASLVQDEKKNITLRFVARETCSFVCVNSIEIESPHRVVEENTISTSTENIVSQVLSRVVKTKIKEYHWKVEIEHGIYIYSGDETAFDAPNSVPIITNTISSNLVTRTDAQPFSPTVDVDPLDVSLTWLLKTLNKESLQSEFHIDREKSTCRTPRNNDDIRGAWEFFTNIQQWCGRVSQYFITKDDQIVEKDKRDKLHLSSITGQGVFVPVLPLFETLKEGSNSNSNSNQQPIISNEDVNLFLNKQYHSMTENIESLQKTFHGQIMSAAEAILVLLSKHASQIARYYFWSVNHVEDMLCTQLYNAIGKHVSSDDLDDFVRSYNQKLFVDTYAPEPFCYAIRRPGHYPDGLLSIEEVQSSGTDKGAERNAMTFTRQLETSDGANPMYIPINSATSIQFSGDLYLHAWMMQRFQHSHPSFQLASRARQFSSFLVLVGKLSGPNTFEPEHGIILQNQDEVLIPILLEEMPSAKEFKDAIESLSPEQQRFAKAFRNMKLSSSVFGVCVVQLKPQLEAVLGLPEKALTKEIRLTESLLTLFIDYQIPSDLLSFDGDESLDDRSKVEVVRGYVKKVEDMIDELKERDLNKAQLEADMAYELRATEEDCYTGSAGLFGSAAPAASPFGAASPFSAAPPRPSPGAHLSTSNASMPQMSQQFRGSKDRPRKMMAKRSIATKVALPASSSSSISTQSHQENTQTSRTGATVELLSTQQNSNAASPSNQHTDLTMIPKVLDSKFEMFGDDEKYGGALRSTIIKTGEMWTKKGKANILSKLKTSSLNSDKQKSERQKAFDLLDALSRSGVLPMSHAELHVVVASTHCFDKSVVNTVVQDNVNPIEKIERSHLLVASVIHSVTVKELLSNVDELSRIGDHSPPLLMMGDVDVKWDE